MIKRLIVLLVLILLDANATTVKMQNKDSWNMAHDKSFIYALTRNYKQKSYKIEIYDKNLKFINSKQLRISKSFLKKYKNTYVKIYNKPESIAVSDKYLYIGTRQNIIFYDKKTLKRINAYTVASPDIWYDEKEKLYVTRTNDVEHFTNYKDYIIAYGEGDNIYIFKDDKIVRTINIKKDYPKNITQIHDYFEGTRINTVLVHKDKLYAGNWRGFVNIYDLKRGVFLDQISTIGFNKEYKYITADEVNYISVYKNRWIYMGLDYKGLLVFDTKTDELKSIKTLFKKQRAYSKLFKQYFDNTKSTSIYKMLFYKDNLIFSEVNNKKDNLHVYNLKTKKILKKFKEHKGSITSMFIEGSKLFGLSNEGYIYKFDLKIYD